MGRLDLSQKLVSSQLSRFTTLQRVLCRMCLIINVNKKYQYYNIIISLKWR